MCEEKRKKEVKGGGEGSGARRAEGIARFSRESVTEKGSEVGANDAAPRV